VLGQGQVTQALASGRFSVTDGPALRMAVDVNLNGVIDGPDVPMGGVDLTPWRGKYVPFVVEWKSTDEFGPLAGIDLYVGVTSDGLDLGFVYAAENHGIHSPNTRPGRVGPNRYVDAQGGTHPELFDGYMLDPTGKLHITLTAAEGKAGSKMVFLRPDDFVVGRRRIAQEEPVCRPNIWCTRPGYPELCKEECSEPPPPTYHFDNLTVPDRIYVRAFARTTPKGGAYCAEQAPDISDRARIEQKTGQCIARLAFTNPVWVDSSAAPPPGDFGITCTPATLTIPNAGSRTSTCTVTSTNGFNKPVSLGCSGLPSETACSFSPATVTPPANGSASSTLTTSVGLTPQGSYTFRAEGTVTSIHRRHATIALTVSGSQVRNLTATYDPARQAPSCVPSKLGGSCDTGPSLVFGRGAGDAEQNASNTIGGMCADGESTPKTTDRWNANDRIRVSTYDGTHFAPGKMVRIDATVFALTTTIDAADFYYAADAANPSWTLIRSVVPTTVGAQTLSTSYRLPAGGVQAVRVQFRQGGDNAPCTAGGFHDRDDLVFLVDPSQ